MRSSLSRSPIKLFAPFLVACVETAVVSPLLALLDAIADRNDVSRSPVAIALGIIGLIGFLVTRWMQQRDIGIRTLQLVLIGGAAVLAVIAPPVQGLGTLWNADRTAVAVLAAGAAVIAWWRGMHYAGDPDPFGADRMSGLVKYGWIALVAQVLLLATVENDRADAASDVLRVAMPVAVVAGMLLLAFGQIEQARVNATRRGGRAPERKGWLVYAAVFAILLLVVAALGSAVLGGEAANWILTPLALLVRGVAFVLTWVLIGASLIVFVLLYPLIWLLRRLRADPLEQEQESEGELGGFEQIVNDGTNGLPDAVQTAIQIGAIVLVIAIVLLLLALTMRRVRSQPEADTASEERESLWSRDLAMSQLRNLFKRGDQDALDRIDLRRTPPTVRDAYRALQALAAREGTPRLEAETPSAFGSRLARAWPEQAAAIMELTRRYERVRYGETPDDAERATALQAWSTIVAARNRD